MTRGRLADRLLLGAAIAWVVAAVGFALRLWPLVQAFAAAPGTTPDGMQAVVDRAGASLTALGTLTAVLALAALARDGGIAGRRGRLRIASIGLVVASGLVGAVVLEPIGEDIRAAVRADPTLVPALLGRWWGWRMAALALAATALAGFAVAHRAPVVPPAPDAVVLEPRHRVLLGLLGTATLFEGYDRFIVTLALPYIARDLGAAEGVLGWALSAIRAGALVAIVLGLLADRVGRRRILLVTVLGYTIATGLTGLSRGMVDFVLLQLIAVAFLNTELSLAQVVIAEEFPARARGMGQGLLGAAAAVGAGLAAMLFPLIAPTALGWRGLYLIGIVPLLVVGWLRRSLPETTRWSRLDPSARRAAGVLAVMAPAHRRRFIVLMLLAAGSIAAFGAAYAFASYRATTTFGWSPARVSTMVLVGGGLGFWGWILFGRFSDASGRRVAGGVALLGLGAAIVCFYSTTYLFAAFAALVFFEAGTTIAVNALSTEVFPTALRATARAWIANAGVFGGMLGLGAVGLLSGRLDGYGNVIALLGLLPFALAPLMLVLPETRGRELEAASGEVVEAPPTA